MKLVLFCDYGLDDAAATADALRHALADGFDRVDLVAVGGNVPADVALKNAVKLVHNLDFPLPEMNIVDTTAYSQPCEYLKLIHGGDGMGDLFEDVASSDVPVLSFQNWLDGLREFVLLSLGPMTLVPHALAKNPKTFIFMGGNIAEEPNFHGYEFNHALNREAFAECVKYPHVAITMDTCRHPLINLQHEKIEEKDILHKIVHRAQERTFLSGEKGCYVWDDIAVKYLRHPDWFELYPAHDRDGNLLSVAKYTLGKKFLSVLGI